MVCVSQGYWQNSKPIDIDPKGRRLNKRANVSKNPARRYQRHLQSIVAVLYFILVCSVIRGACAFSGGNIQENVLTEENFAHP